MQGRLLDTIERYLDGTTRRGDVDHLGDGILEWRVRKSNNNYRILFFEWGHVAVALTCFYKNQQQTPPGDLTRAKQRRTAWINTRGAKPPSS